MVIVKNVLNTRNMSFYMLRLRCTGKLIFIGGFMKFLKINAKVLLILCLFSGILFLSTGCGDNTDKDADTKDPDSSVSTPTEGNNNEDQNSNTETNNDNAIGDGSIASNDVDYSVWVANTTINTDKDQKSYKVIWGDTLWLISTAWEVSYQEIAAFNNIPNPDLIYVDQVIYNPLFK